MSNLISYCSVATVACIWYIDFLLPTLFGVSCRCNYFPGGHIYIYIYIEICINSDTCREKKRERDIYI